MKVDLLAAGCLTEPECALIGRELGTSLGVGYSDERGKEIVMEGGIDRRTLKEHVYRDENDLTKR